MKKNIFFNKIFDQLYPIHRSIVGPGIRNSLKIIKKYINIKVENIPTGSKAFDWKIPKEWRLVEGYIKYKNKIILDAKKNNLSVINYSTSVDKIVDLKDLKKKIYTHPKLKKATPYVTSYYKDNWGFCMSENQKQKLKNGNYYIKIKTEKKTGNLNYGEAKLKGNSNKIFLLTTFLCHPSMANNELSGPLTLIGLYNNISKWKNRNLNYNFLIHPETIGSIVYIKKNLSTLKKKVHSGSVLTCMGGQYKNLSYFKSRNSKSPLDKLIEYFAKQNKFKIYNFNPSEGGDERQFCGGEVNLPIGRLERNGKGHFKEYHTDLDKKNIMNINKITNSVESLSYILEYNDYMFPILRYEKYCELFMSKRNLYPETNDFINTIKKDKDLNHKIIMTLISYADGKIDYLDIVNLYEFPIKNVLNCLKFLIKIKLIYLKL